ncbi:MAG: TlpA family protein disulfide reductase [Deltaproteobacteria bacterium]|jgi:peroxiredoxin|nr:TlpA family protein disulfide reductase [Deltaproteobacteria bacterium]
MILVIVAGVGCYLFYSQYAAVAGSPEQELERLFGNMGILKMPHATRPLEIQLKDISGNTVSLSDFRGKIVFLNFWATWCPACVVEMPSMEKLHHRFKNQDFVMIAVNMQESAMRVKSFFEKLQLSFTALLDTSGEVAAGMAVTALPTTYFMDKEGGIIGVALGPREWDNRASIELFEFLINRPESFTTRSGA